MELIIIVSFICLALIGFLIGFFKGFTNVKTWGNDYFFSTVCVLVVASIVKKVEGDARLYLIAGLAIGFILLFTFLSARVKIFFDRGIERSKLRSYYSQYEARMENDEDIIDALADKDERRYRRLSSRKFDGHEGVMGVFNRVFGGITLAIKAVVIVGLIASFAFMIIDFVQVDALNKVFGELYASRLWASVKKYAFDFYFMGIAVMCIRIGFKGGLFNKLWFFAVLALLGGAGYASYHLAFNVDSFQPLAEGLGASFGQAIDPFVQAAQTVLPGFTAVTVGRHVVMVGIFIVLLIPVILIAIFVPKLVDCAREGAAFSAIDGIFGAVVLLAVIMAIIFFLGGMLYTLNDLEFMAKYNEYMDGSKIAYITYSGNFMNKWSFFVDLPLKDWLVGTPSAS